MFVVLLGKALYHPFANVKTGSALDLAEILNRLKVVL